MNRAMRRVARVLRRQKSAAGEALRATEAARAALEAGAVVEVPIECTAAAVGAIGDKPDRPPTSDTHSANWGLAAKGKRR